MFVGITFKFGCVRQSCRIGPGTGVRIGRTASGTADLAKRSAWGSGRMARAARPEGKAKSSPLFSVEKIDTFELVFQIYGLY